MELQYGVFNIMNVLFFATPSPAVVDPLLFCLRPKGARGTPLGDACCTHDETQHLCSRTTPRRVDVVAPVAVDRSIIQVGPDGDFAAATKDVASLVYLCKPQEGCLPDQAWESSSHKYEYISTLRLLPVRVLNEEGSA